MKASLLALALLLAGSVTVPAYQKDTGDKTVGQDLKGAGSDVKDATKRGAVKTKNGVEKGTTKSTHAVKKGTHKAASETEKGADKLKDKTADTSTHQ